MDKHNRRYENFTRHKDCDKDNAKDLMNSMEENYPMMPMENHSMDSHEMNPMDILGAGAMNPMQMSPAYPVHPMMGVCPMYHMGGCPMAQMNHMGPVAGMQYMPMNNMGHHPMNHPVAGMMYNMPMCPSMPMHHMYPMAGMDHMGHFDDDDFDDED